MLSRKITDDDRFINLSASAQALYLHLVMSADDDGFTNQIQMSMFKAHATSQDYEALKTSNFIIEFKDDAIVIRHWLIQNTLQNDRYNETLFTEDKEALKIERGKPYEIMDTNRIQNVYSLETEHNLTKHNLTKHNKEKDILSGNPDGASLDLSGESQKSGKKKQSFSSEVNEIIDYLNHQTGRNYRKVSSNTRLIEARLKEGYTVHDFQTVIDKKCMEWLNDPEMKQYLRPETLFSPKHFESYLNAPLTQKKGTGLVF